MALVSALSTGPTRIPARSAGPGALRSIGADGHVGVTASVTQRGCAVP